MLQRATNQPDLDPPPPYTRPAAVSSADSSPVTVRAHQHVPALVAHSLPSLLSIVPPPLEPKETDAMDELCDCGAAFEGRVEHELDRRRTSRLEKMVLLMWIPMMICVLCLALFRLVATNDNFVSKFVSMHAAFLQHV
ncbi:hypothetical protein HDU97_008182 [Phlyctochytrium planicorne]|nr:hypothetical protein HDU97_008182 [Phlyctochytrium planicorne]